MDRSIRFKNCPAGTMTDLGRTLSTPIVVVVVVVVAHRAPIVKLFGRLMPRHGTTRHTLRARPEPNMDDLAWLTPGAP